MIYSYFAILLICMKHFWKRKILPRPSIPLVMLLRFSRDSVTNFEFWFSSVCVWFFLLFLFPYVEQTRTTWSIKLKKTRSQIMTLCSVQYVGLVFVLLHGEGVLLSTEWCSSCDFDCWIVRLSAKVVLTLFLEGRRMHVGSRSKLCCLVAISACFLNF